MVTKEAIILFPGQGAQYPLMAVDLHEASRAVQALFAEASAASGIDLLALLRDSDAETLKRTDISQPAITLANLAAATMLKERGILPAAVAGFSLGEYAALALSGVVSVADCFRLVTARGKAMQKAADAIAASSGGEAPGMAAVLGLAPETVEKLIGEWKAAGLSGLYAANFNSPRQVVIAGTAAALTEAEARFKEAGAKRVLRLKVAGPFHSPLVADAAREFAPILEATNFGDPAIPLFSNVTGERVSTGAEAKALALRQITEGVRWTSEEAALAALAAEKAIDTILEAGPGTVLAGLWRDSGSTIPATAAGKLSEIQTIGGQ